MPARRSLKIVGYVGFALAALFVSFYFTFPAQAVGQRLASELQQRSHGKVSFAFADVSPFRLSGVAAEGVKVSLQREGGEPLDLEVDALRARLRLLPLLLLRTALSAELQAGEGVISADLAMKGDAYDVALDVDGLDFAAPPILPKLAGFPFGGQLSAQGSASTAAGLQKASGELELRVDKASLGPGTVQGFTAPAVGLGDLRANLEMKDGKLRITKFEQSGGQLEVSLSGDVTLRQSLSASSLDVCLQFKFTDQAFLDKNAKLKSALQLAEVRFQKDSKGFLNLPLRGTLGHPQPGRGVCRKG